jgi:hypothetical protein
VKGNASAVLIAAAQWWPCGARLAMAFRRHRCRIIGLCPVGHPLRSVSGLERVETYAGIRSISSLRESLQRAPVDLIVPCDDGVVAQLHALHTEESSLRGLIERSIGDPRHFPLLRCRYDFLAAARELGVAVPDTVRADNADMLVTPFGGTAVSVLKVDGLSGGNGVRICRGIEERETAWRELSAPGTRMTAWKRLLIDRNPLALWQRRQSAPEITLQDFIAGRPANSMVACSEGRVLGMVSVEVLAAESTTGAATIVRRIDDPVLTDNATRIAARLGLSGFFGLDYVIESGTGRAVLIEINPRSTQLGHLEFEDQGSLVGLLAAHLRGVTSRPLDPIARAGSIAFFPQALLTGALSAGLLESCHHDVPWSEPALVRELLLPTWPQRRGVARLYHRLRPLRRALPIRYDLPAVAATSLAPGAVCAR